MRELKKSKRPAEALEMRSILMATCLVAGLACASSKDAGRSEQAAEGDSAATREASGAVEPGARRGGDQAPNDTAGTSVATAPSADALEQPARQPDVIYVPTPDTVVQAMLDVAKVTEDDVLYDLGSGDGRIVIAAAKGRGTSGTGIDIDPARVREARENARKAGVTDKAKFLEQDLFETDFHDATVVTLYLLPDLNVKLRPALFEQLDPGTRVVSHAFSMGEWEADSAFQVEHRQVFFWIIPAQVAGTWEWTVDAGSKPVKQSVELQQRFQRVSGHMVVDGEIFNATDFRLRGDSLSFVATGRMRGKDVTMKLRGRVRDDTLRGKIEIQGGPVAGTHDWKARRTKSGQAVLASTAR